MIFFQTTSIGGFVFVMASYSCNLLLLMKIGRDEEVAERIGMDLEGLSSSRG